MSTLHVEKRNHVLAFVALKHVEQKRKYTGEPYLFHLHNVAKMADGKCSFGYEIGLCHDLFEDTDCTKGELILALQRFGYNENQRQIIVSSVEQLTDIYTSEAYPELNRKKRKQLEAERLQNISEISATVKYCDLIDNTKSIVEHDPGFAVKYIAEKEEILRGMINGNKKLLKECQKSLEWAKNELKQVTA